jgi:hypothetical protein
MKKGDEEGKMQGKYGEGVEEHGDGEHKGNTMIGEGNIRKGVRIMRMGNVVMWAGRHGRGRGRGTWG